MFNPILTFKPQENIGWHAVPQQPLAPACAVGKAMSTVSPLASASPLGSDAWRDVYSRADVGFTQSLDEEC